MAAAPAGDGEPVRPVPVLGIPVLSGRDGELAALTRPPPGPEHQKPSAAACSTTTATAA